MQPDNSPFFKSFQFLSPTTPTHPQPLIPHTSTHHSFPLQTPLFISLLLRNPPSLNFAPFFPPFLAVATHFPPRVLQPQKQPPKFCGESVTQQRSPSLPPLLSPAPRRPHPCLSVWVCLPSFPPTLFFFQTVSSFSFTPSSQLSHPSSITFFFPLGCGGVLSFGCVGGCESVCASAQIPQTVCNKAARPTHTTAHTHPSCLSLDDHLRSLQSHVRNLLVSPSLYLSSHVRNNWAFLSGCDN